MQHSKRLYDKGLLKNRKMLTQTQYADYKFVGQLENIKTLLSGIKALCFDEIGMVQIAESGFCVTVEQGKVVQASLFMTPNYFTNYHIKETVKFSIKLNLLVDCLCFFADCSVKMLYKGDGAPLVLILEPHDDDDLSTECSIKTICDEDTIDYQLNQDSSCFNSIVMHGPAFAQMIQEIDSAVEEYDFTISPQSLKITGVGKMQVHLDFQVPKTSDLFLLFQCRKMTQARYKVSLIKLIYKALAVAYKVSIKTDETGLLEMHFMIQSEEDNDLYVKFFLMSQS